MRKTAIFVEGQTELIFVREYLLRHFNWQVDIICRELLSDGVMRNAEYNNRVNSSKFHFQIINVGGDTVVLRRLLQRELALINQGYDRIVGLRDMFTEEYSIKSNGVNEEVNQLFINTFNKAIDKNAKHPDKIRFCFAIMETEAWLIGLYEVLQRMNEKLTLDAIKEKTKIDLKENDPEQTLFQPSKTLNEIFEIAGMEYKKKKGDIEKIMNVSVKEDFDALLQKPICNQFNLFHKAIIES